MNINNEIKKTEELLKKSKDKRFDDILYARLKTLKECKKMIEEKDSKIKELQEKYNRATREIDEMWKVKKQLK